MLEVKVRGSRSWLDQTQAPFLAQILKRRLSTRMDGEAALFITLTYDRSRYVGPRDLYRAQAEGQHVPRFLRRLNRALWKLLDRKAQRRWLRENPAEAHRAAESARRHKSALREWMAEGRAGAKPAKPRFVPNMLKARWVRKLEFQQGGWCHFHLVIVWPRPIDWALIERCWGHGFIDVRRFEAHHVGYMSKYFGKSDPCPAFLMHEKPRSVKIIAASPGFWLDTVKRDYPESIDPFTRLPGYVPIGDRIERGRHTIIVRDTETGEYQQVFCDLGSLLAVLLRDGIRSGAREGWLTLNVTFDRLMRAASIARREAAGPSGPAEVNSISNQNPCYAEGRRWLPDPVTREEPPIWGPDRVGPWFHDMLAVPSDEEMAAALL